MCQFGIAMIGKKMDYCCYRRMAWDPKRFFGYQHKAGHFCNAESCSASFIAALRLKKRNGFPLYCVPSCAGTLSLHIIAKLVGKFNGYLLSYKIGHIISYNHIIVEQIFCVLRHYWDWSWQSACKHS